MEELTVQDIESALLSYAEGELDWPDYGQYINYSAREYDVPGLGLVKIIDYNDADYDKNYDGWYEHLWIVFDIQGRLYRAKGKHTSYTGSEWEDHLKPVEARPKTITVYEDIEGESA